MADVVIKVKHSFTVMETKEKFSVMKYEAIKPVTLPDGSMKQTVTAKGYNLPHNKGITYELSGSFKPYTKDGRTSFTFNVEKSAEILPTEEETIVAYLVTLDGIGKSTAIKLYDAFGKKVFSVIANKPDDLLKIKGISRVKASKISISFASRQTAKELFAFLYQFGLKNNAIMRVYEEFGTDAVSKVMENPYRILNLHRIGFKTADAIARKSGLHKNSPERIRAGILETLSQGEHGGEVFNKTVPCPSFMLGDFLRDELKEKISQSDTYTTGGTYLPRDILYINTLRLLDLPLSEEDFDGYLYELNAEKKIFLSVKSNVENEDVKVYRQKLAACEYEEAETLSFLLKVKLPVCENLLETIRNKERDNSILLSNEQRAAVIKAITSPVSVITGGPGTGKTSIEKIIIATFRKYFPKDGILLAAPTGKAAKRMSEQTGLPAQTLHKALKLYADDCGDMIEKQAGSKLSEKLIIIDEASMVGSYLFNTLLSHISTGTRLVMIGDIDQLPSIEVGAVLRELISCGGIPTTKLTKTFRQSSGSSIITNASRIKIGEKRLDFDENFSFVSCSSSAEIAEKAAELIPVLASEYGESEVMCLTAFRHKTESGSNALNEKLRAVMHPPKEGCRYFDARGTRIYEGDKVMNIKNTELLTNGDIGIVKTIVRNNGSLIVSCDFDGIIVALEDSEAEALELAYATTVHKSQGSEASCVVLTADTNHKIMLRRNLLYTGVTRAKRKLIILGQPEALAMSIETQDSVFRRSQLGSLINYFLSRSSHAAHIAEPEQLSFL